LQIVFGGSRLVPWDVAVNLIGDRLPERTKVHFFPGMPLIDTHTHLDHFARAGELPAVLERARVAGVEAMIAIGTEPEDWPLYRDLVAQHRGVIHYTVGLHPCSVDENWKAAVDELAAWRERGGVPPVAIGETGLDRFHLPKNDVATAKRLFGWQRDSFRTHIDLARAWNVPLVVHSRGAGPECIAVIDESGFDWRRVIFHCFSDGPIEIAELNRRGGRGSFTGIATYKSAENVRQAAIAQGLDRLMLETDAPYLTPEPLPRKSRNEPAFVAHTAAALARVFAISPEELAARSTANARRFFGL
jgi:TatD DNase family protein